MNTDLLKQLAKAREDYETHRTAANEMIEKVKNSPDYQHLKFQRDIAQTLVENLEADIKAAAQVRYTVDQNKKPGNGIEIKIFKVATILDPDRAREWCMTNFRPALKLDETMLRKAAVDGGTIPASVVTVTEEPRAQIASDLSEFLPNPLICQVTGKLKTECTGGDCDCIPF